MSLHGVYIWCSDVNILWRIDPLLTGDSVNSDRFWATTQ
jgi:hypothetical protein